MRNEKVCTKYNIVKTVVACDLCPEKDACTEKEEVAT